jgi:hypothetical protein
MSSKYKLYRAFAELVTKLPMVLAFIFFVGTFFAAIAHDRYVYAAGSALALHICFVIYVKAKWRVLCAVERKHGMCPTPGSSFRSCSVGPEVQASLGCATSNNPIGRLVIARGAGETTVVLVFVAIGFIVSGQWWVPLLVGLGLAGLLFYLRRFGGP